MYIKEQWLKKIAHANSEIHVQHLLCCNQIIYLMPQHILGPHIECKRCIHSIPSTLNAPVLLWGWGRKEGQITFRVINDIVIKVFRYNLQRKRPQMTEEV